MIVSPKVYRVARLLATADGRDPDDSSVHLTVLFADGTEKRQKNMGPPYWHAYVDTAKKVVDACRWWKL